MRAFLGSMVMLVVLTVGAAIVLGSLDMSSQSVYSSQSTRH